MTTEVKSRSSLDGEIIKIGRGLAIYKVKASPFYMLRLRDVRNKRNIVRSTKETSRIEARKVAEEFAASQKNNIPVPKVFRFEYYADVVIKDAFAKVARKEKKVSHISDIKHALYNESRGLANYFCSYDVRDITTKDWTSFVRKVQQREPMLSSSIHNHMRIYFRKVLLAAQMDGVINLIPDLPKLHHTVKSSRTYFRFQPAVPREQDEYIKLKHISKKLAQQNIKVRGVPITDELHDIIVFTVDSFVRPSYSELYGLRHKDVLVLGEGRTLKLTINGKTGLRYATTMKGAVSIYKRCCERNPNHTPDDYIFLPQYKNRRTAMVIMQRQFDYLLKAAGLKIDSHTGKRHSMYSLRHTALVMRLVNSQGEINTYVLAKNAGTSIEMLENHYIPEVPPTDAIIDNLQSFGKKKKLAKKDEN